MIENISRRNLLRLGCGTTMTLGFSLVGAELASQSLAAQSRPVRSVEDDFKEDLFYREDWLGEPWRKPEPVVLIHGNDESSVQWYAWVPRMAQEYRLIRPDLPGLGHSTVPPGFEYLARKSRQIRHAGDGQSWRGFGTYRRREDRRGGGDAFCR